MSLILFDFDGVLADTLNDLTQIAQEVCNELGVKRLVTEDDLRSLEVMSFAGYGRKLDVPNPLLDDFIHRCLAQIGEKKSQPRVFHGLSNVVRNLSSSHTIGVVTGNSSGNVKAFLLEHKLDDCVHAIYGVDSSGSKAEKILLLQNQFAAKDEPVFMVGDSASDIHAAKEAGVKSIAVSWGYQSIETLTRAKPDYLVHAPEELHNIIGATRHSPKEASCEANSP